MQSNAGAFATLAFVVRGTTRVPRSRLRHLVRPLRLAWRVAMDEPLYDEFGNYVGPPLDQDEEEEEEEALEARRRPSRTAATSAHACALLAAAPRHTYRCPVQPRATLRVHRFRLPTFPSRASPPRLAQDERWMEEAEARAKVCVRCTELYSTHGRDAACALALCRWPRTQCRRTKAPHLPAPWCLRRTRNTTRLQRRCVLLTPRADVFVRAHTLRLSLLSLGVRRRNRSAGDGRGRATTGGAWRQLEASWHGSFP